MVSTDDSVNYYRQKHYLVDTLTEYQYRTMLEKYIGMCKNTQMARRSRGTTADTSEQKMNAHVPQRGYVCASTNHNMPVPKMGGYCGISGNPTPGPKYFRTPMLGFAEVGGVFIPRGPPQKISITILVTTHLDETNEQTTIAI